MRHSPKYLIFLFYSRSVRRSFSFIPYLPIRFSGKSGRTRMPITVLMPVTRIKAQDGMAERTTQSTAGMQ